MEIPHSSDQDVRARSRSKSPSISIPTSPSSSPRRPSLFSSNLISPSSSPPRSPGLQQFYGSSPTRSRSASTVTFDEHQFEPHTFEDPEKCNCCREFIWGLAAQGYRCSVCDFAVHTQCFAKVNLYSCTGKSVLQFPKAFARIRKLQFDVDPTPQEEKDEDGLMFPVEEGNEVTTFSDQKLIEENDKVAEIISLTRDRDSSFFMVEDTKKSYKKTLQRGPSIASYRLQAASTSSEDFDSHSQKRQSRAIDAKVDLMAQIAQEKHSASFFLSQSQKKKREVEEKSTIVPTPTNQTPVPYGYPSSHHRGEEQLFGLEDNRRRHSIDSNDSEGFFSESETDKESDEDLESSTRDRPKIKNVYELHSHSSSLDAISGSNNSTSPLPGRRPSAVASSPPPRVHHTRSDSVSSVGDNSSSSYGSNPGSRTGTAARSKLKPTSSVPIREQTPDTTWLLLSTKEKEVCVNIQLQLGKEEYQPGETIEGNLFIELIRPLVETNGVKILVQGFEKAFSGNPAFRMEGVGRKGRTSYESKMFFKHVVSLWEPSEEENCLDPGQHTWTFSFTLPINLPPTVFIDEDYASIFYQIRGFVDPGNSKSPSHLKIVSQTIKFDVYGVHSKMWREVIRKFSKPISANILSKEETVRLTASIHRKDFLLGEHVSVSFKIENQSSKGIEPSSFKISLLQTVKLHVKSYHVEFEEKKISAQTFHFKGFRLEPNATSEKTLSLGIPEEHESSILPSTTGLFFTVSHHLRIVTKIRGVKPLVIPIRIWDALWDDEDYEQSMISLSGQRPSVTFAPSDWSFQVVRVWMKSLFELPVAIDLPRLAMVTTVVDYTQTKNRKVGDKDEYLEAIDDYKGTNILVGGDTDFSFKKGDLFKLIDEKADSWLKVKSEQNQVVGLAPSNILRRVEDPLINKESKILDILTSLASSLENSNRSDLISQNWWKYIPQNPERGGNRDISKELSKFFSEVLKEDNPTARLIKACSQSIIAPPVIEMTLNVSPKLPFADGGGWRVRIGITRDNVRVTHWKTQRHLPNLSLHQKEQFRFEWELTLTFNKKAELIRDFSFRLNKVDFASEVEETRREEVMSILENYFSRGPSKSEGKLIGPSPPSSPTINSPTASPPSSPQKEQLDTRWTQNDGDDQNRENWQQSLENKEAVEKVVNKFFSIDTVQKLRELDVVNDNWHVKLLNLNQYQDEDEEFYRRFGQKMTLEDKIRRKWNKPLPDLLVATILPNVYQNIEITTVEGLLRQSTWTETGGKVDQTGKTIKIRKLLETIAILLHDTKEALPNLIRHFKEGELTTTETSAHYLGRFFKEYMKEEFPTIRLLKVVNLSIMALAYSFIRDHFLKKFPITDIGAAWKINFKIGDGLRNNSVTVTHSKCAKSLDSSVEGSFELMWQLRISLDYEMKDIQSVSLQIPSVQTSHRFPKAKLKELQSFIKNFNTLDHSHAVIRRSTTQQDHNQRKKARQKLRKLPKSDLSNPTLRKDCTLYVKVIEANNMLEKKAQANVNRKKRSASMLRNVRDSTPINPYVVLVVSDQRHRTRTLFQSVRPYWAEEYNFEVSNSKLDVLKVTVWNSHQFNSDSVVGFVHIPISHLKIDEAVEDWFDLQLTQSTRNSLDSSSGSTGEKQQITAGQLRLKIKYAEEVVLPAPLYDEMFNLLVEKGLRTVKLLGRVCDDRQQVCLCLVKLFEEKNIAAMLLTSLANDELAETNDPDIIFRGNSFATKALDCYMRFIGQTYLLSTLSSIIKKIFTSKKSYEIDPSKLEKNQSLEKNVKNFIKLVRNTLEAIWSSAENCPAILREIFHELKGNVEDRFTLDKSEKARYIIVSGFIFLRFFCVAITAPKSYNITEEHPDVNATRTLTLLAKVIQKIANLTHLASDEEYMKSLHPLIEEQTPLFKLYIERISSIPLNPPPRVRPPIQIEKELASVHRYLKKYKDKMVKFQHEDEHFVVKKLEAVLDDLEYISQHEKVFEYP